jgi:hypothetical protein
VIFTSVVEGFRFEKIRCRNTPADDVEKLTSFKNAIQLDVLQAGFTKGRKERSKKLGIKYVKLSDAMKYYTRLEIFSVRERK